MHYDGNKLEACFLRPVFKSERYFFVVDFRDSKCLRKT